MEGISVCDSLCAEAKVGDLDLSVLPEQNVVRLDVSVQDPPLVQVADPLQGLKQREITLSMSYVGQLIWDTGQTPHMGHAKGVTTHILMYKGWPIRDD